MDLLSTVAEPVDELFGTAAYTGWRTRSWVIGINGCGPGATRTVFSEEGRIEFASDQNRLHVDRLQYQLRNPLGAILQR